LVNLSLEDLEKLYNKLPLGHKLLITRTWSYGFYEIGDGYRNGAKLELLDKLSGGAMNNILKELYGR